MSGQHADHFQYTERKSMDGEIQDSEAWLGRWCGCCSTHTDCASSSAYIGYLDLFDAVLSAPINSVDHRYGNRTRSQIYELIIREGVGHIERPYTGVISRIVIES